MDYTYFQVFISWIFQTIADFLMSEPIFWFVILFFILFLVKIFKELVFNY